MLLRLLPVLLLLFGFDSFARCPSSSSFDQAVLDQIFTLRDAAHLGVLENEMRLNAVAQRVAAANLDREERLEHVDAEGKGLTIRTKEELYSGIAGEIVSVVYLPCEEAPFNPSSNERGKELGLEFQNAIRNSPSHYNGLMARTGVLWNQFGYSIRSKQVFVGKSCMQKYSLGLVVGFQ